MTRNTSGSSVRLGVGIVGTGRISELHAAAYADEPRALITAVADRDVRLARAKAQAWGVPADCVFESLDDLLACPEVDLVEILLPHHLHRSAALAALAAGKDVSLQKPIALTLRDADELVEASERSGRVMRVFENFLFYPPVQFAKRLLDEGEIGDALAIRLKSTGAFSRTSWDVPEGAIEWRQDPLRCGGGPMLFDDGAHKCAILVYFMGLPEKVHAWIGRTEISPGRFKDAPSIVSMVWRDGRIGSFEAVHARDLEVETRHYAQDDRIEITGTKGVIWVTRGHSRMTDEAPVILYRDRRTVAFSSMDTRWDQSFVAATRHLLDAYARGDRHPVMQPRDARDVLSLALAVQESGRSGREARLDGVTAPTD